MQCETLKEVLEKIHNCFVNCTISQEERDDLTYSYRQAVESIKAWKSHQLRCSRQDEARTNVLDNLDQNSVHITQDWAMKFLPQKYRVAIRLVRQARNFMAHYCGGTQGSRALPAPDFYSHCGEL